MNKKENKFTWFMERVVGLNGILLVGEYIFWLVGGLIVIERMVEFFINSIVPMSSGVGTKIYVVCFIWAIVSVPIFISYKMINKIIGEKDE